MTRLLRSPLTPIAIALLCGVAWLVLAYRAPEDGTPWRDQQQYHLPTIQKFADDFPRFDLTNYNAASTPGYHLVLATVIHFTGDSIFALRLANAVFSAGCIGTAMWLCSRWAPWGWVFALPLLLSPYFHYSAIWLRPDNASWLFVFLILGISVGKQFGRREMLIGAGLLVLLAVFRHAHLWCAAPLCAAAYCASGDLKPTRRNLTQLGTMIVLTIPAILIVTYFVKLWGGLVPPHFQTVEGIVPEGHSGWKHEGPNWAVPMFVMALIGLLSIVCVPIAWRRLPRNRSVLLLGAMVLLPIALLTPSNWDETRGRRSGIWNIAQHLPAPMQRSVLLVPLAIWGGAAIAWLLSACKPVFRWIMLVALLAFIAAQTTNAMAWQKYYEPFVIAYLGAMLVHILSATDRPTLDDRIQP